MTDLFDKVLHYCGRKGDNLFLINVGAMDGILFDELIGYSTMYKFKGLYVEPIPYLFNRLQNNISEDGNKFENSAISDYDGTIKMITIKQEAIDNKLIHSCFYGMSAVWPPKNGLGSEGDKEVVEKYGEEVEVNCITFNTLLEKHDIKNFDIVSIDAEGHDYQIFKQIDLNKFRPKLIRAEWNSLNEEEQNLIKEQLDKNNYSYEIMNMNIDAVPNELIVEIEGVLPQNSETIVEEKSKVTIVTGIWDIKREELTEGWSRNFQHYLNNLEKLLKTQDNMIIYIEEKYYNFVKQRRNDSNTSIIIRELDWFKNNGDLYEKVQKIRTNPDWYSQSGWLVESTQAKLDMYNPLVMSKMFLLNDASILDPFNSDYMVWVDGALTNTVHEGYFWKDNIISKFEKYLNKFSFVCFPYDGKVEIHGFKYAEICSYSEGIVNKVARGGIFGGPKSLIPTVNNFYYGLLNETLNKGLMGTEESIFTIMTYKYPELIQYFEIEKNGLLGTFFENLKNETLEPKQEKTDVIKQNLHTRNNVALYVLTYNSPKQFEKLCISFEEYDKNFLTVPKKYLLNNSLNHDTDVEYKELCEKYGFEEIKKDNLGICGGRQFISEHSDENGFDYHFFFEDDMFFYLGKDEFCRNGFRRRIKDFFNIVMDIVWEEDFDFLKWNFSEFFGDNTKQWSWHNVPAGVRSQLFPDKPVKTTNNVDDAPYLNYKNIKSKRGLPYATGEIYYCNWPQVVSREGNKKMFLNTKWAHPYEQTWMSFIYQETIKGNINTAILLATPTEHNRFDHYTAEERREN
jgi:FkbM family methyltransferase